MMYTPNRQNDSLEQRRKVTIESECSLVNKPLFVTAGLITALVLAITAAVLSIGLNIDIGWTIMMEAVVAIVTVSIVVIVLQFCELLNS
jgi:hypothetical protein